MTLLFLLFIQNGGYKTYFTWYLLRNESLIFFHASMVMFLIIFDNYFALKQFMHFWDISTLWVIGKQQSFTNFYCIFRVLYMSVVSIKFGNLASVFEKDA